MASPITLRRESSGSETSARETLSHVGTESRGSLVLCAAAGGLALLALMTGCASVSVQKLDPNGNPVGPEGIHFYRPRPYVSVYEPFVITAEPYVAAGRLTPDGRFIVLTGVPAKLSGRIALHDEAAVVEASRVLVDRQSAVEGSVHTGDLLREAVDAAISKEETDEREEAGSGGTAATKKPPKQGPTKTGQLNLRVANDNKAYAFQPMRRYFDIVYLCDFDEEYCVSSKSRLGNTSADIMLGQGWSLQGMAATVDNDELNKRIFTLMDDAQEMLTAAARTALGIPPIPGGPHAGTLDTADRAFKGGTPVSVKVTVVRLVAPGLYKILKPKELAQLSELKEDPDVAGRILLPVPPVTDIAFNTYEVLVFEAVPMAGDSPLRLHQTLDVSMGAGPGTTPPPAQPTDLTAKENTLNTLFRTAHPGVRVSLTESSDGSTINVKLQIDPGTSLSEADKDDIKEEIRNGLEDTGKKVEFVE